MNSTRSTLTARFRFSIKYLKLEVALHIVCLVPVLLAPKLIFYKSTSELIFTNFKDAAFSSRPSMQCCFAMMQWCIIEFGPRLSDHEITDDHNKSIALYQRIKKHSSGWLSATEQCCTTVWKYVRKHYLFKNAKFPRTKLEENCELRGANHVQR